MNVRSFFALLLLSVLLVLPLQSFAAPSFTPARAQDADFITFSGVVSILQPKYWTLQEYSSEAAYDVNVDVFIMQDQAERGSRATKYVIGSHSNRAGIFSLPASVTSRLTEAQLVNFYIFQNLRNTVGARLTKAENITIGKQAAYKVTWSYLSPRGVAFGVVDIFVFKGDDVYQVHGEYASNLDGDLKAKVQSITDSVKILK